MQSAIYNTPDCLELITVYGTSFHDKREFVAAVKAEGRGKVLSDIADRIIANERLGNYAVELLRGESILTRAVLAAAKKHRNDPIEWIFDKVGM